MHVVKCLRKSKSDAVGSDKTLNITLASDAWLAHLAWSTK